MSSDFGNYGSACHFAICGLSDCAGTGLVPMRCGRPNSDRAAAGRNPRFAERRAYAPNVVALGPTNQDRRRVAQTDTRVMVFVRPGATEGLGIEGTARADLGKCEGPDLGDSIAGTVAPVTSTGRPCWAGDQQRR